MPATVLTHKTPLFLIALMRLAASFMHTSSVGGSSVTLQTADAVNPHHPLAPVLVMMLTAAASRAMPSRNVLLSTGVRQAISNGGTRCGSENLS